ncbi:MAG: DUF4382 domain-containing protein [Burkholderiales bacterium]|nr:DUF4382 domain-containing protein [Burkholderiales bacterium]
MLKPSSKLFGLITALLSACSGGGDGGSPTVRPQGTLHVLLTDAPACGFNAVNVTVAKVRAHRSSDANENDSGWTDIILNPARKINLLNLSNGALEDLGQAPLDAGHYTQLRLVLEPNTSARPVANSVIPAGGTETPLVTPSAVQSGIKLKSQFDVAENTLVDIVLDFDACKSIVARGNGSYSLKPVVRVIPLIVSGGITGVLDPALAASSPMVTAQLDGVVVKGTVPDPQTGSFTLSPIVRSSTAGNYEVVVTAQDHASAVISDVPVVAKANTTVSTSPIMLPASGTHTVSGTVLPVDTEGAVRALQDFPSGPTVTIASQNADLATGAYSFTLPVAAPVLGGYGSGVLPITLSAQSAVAGKYAIEASATGRGTRTANTDITSADVSQNFDLQ